MTRLETFVDAAFAFAVTLLVISIDNIPDSYDDFIEYAASSAGIPCLLAAHDVLVGASGLGPPV